MNPPLPSRKNKTTKTKGIDGGELVYTVIEEDVFEAKSNPQKAFALHKLRHADGREEFRIGYYMIAFRPRVKGKWEWGQYAPIMTRDEMAEVFERAKKLGWLSQSTL